MTGGESVRAELVEARDGVLQQRHVTGGSWGASRMGADHGSSHKSQGAVSAFFVAAMISSLVMRWSRFASPAASLLPVAEGDRNHRDGRIHMRSGPRNRLDRVATPRYAAPALKPSNSDAGGTIWQLRNARGPLVEPPIMVGWRFCSG